MTSKRELRREIERLKRERAAEDGDVDVTVEWRAADPDARPEGMTYDAESGTLTYDVWSAQQDCLDALRCGDATIVAFLAGYGSGKSLTGARWLIAQALAYPGSRFLAMGVDFAKARGSTFRILFDQLPGDRTAVQTGTFNGPEQSPVVADYNRTERRLTLTNDSVIKLGSGEDWSRVAGEEFGGIWLDEPSHYEADLHELLEMVGSRLRGADGPRVQCWTLTGNGYNDAWKILEQRQDSNGDPIGLEIEVIRASTLDNPYLDPGTKDQLKAQFGGSARENQALNGGFAEARGLVYSEFTRETHVIPTADAVERVEDDWRVYGYDYGWSNPRVLLEIGKTPIDQLIVLDEYYERESHVDDAIEWLESHGKPGGNLYCDHDPSEIDTLQQKGYKAQRAEKSLDSGISEVRRRLEADGNVTVDDTTGEKFYGVIGRSSWKATVDEETDSETARGLLVADQCEHLVREFLGYKEDHVKSSEADDHCLDALRYACMGVS